MKQATERLLGCPLCAKAACEESFLRVSCGNERCPLSRCWMTHDEWQSRPIEDDLQERLDTSKATLSKLTEAVIELRTREADLTHDLAKARRRYDEREREWADQKKLAIDRWRERKDREAAQVRRQQHDAFLAKRAGAS